MNKYKYSAIREMGLCTKCAKEKVIPGKTLCSKCAEEKKENYLMLKKYGICVDCRQEKAVYGKTRCSVCATRTYAKKYDPEKAHERYLIKKEKCESEGLCIACGVRPKQHGKICNSCWTTRLIRKNNESNDKRSERVGKSICYTCGNTELLPGKRVCASCYEKRLKAVAKATETRHRKELENVRIG